MHHLRFVKMWNCTLGLADIASRLDRLDLHSKCGIDKAGDIIKVVFIG